MRALFSVFFYNSLCKIEFFLIKFFFLINKNDETRDDIRLLLLNMLPSNRFFFQKFC